MDSPEQQAMDRAPTVSTATIAKGAEDGAKEWQAAVLNTGGYIMFVNGTDYQYKVPYNIQIIGFLSKRISPYCVLADKTCCICLNAGGGIPPAFMDMVDQTSGHQVRYQRTLPKKCGFIRPTMQVYKDGKLVGHMSKSNRLFNRCRTCWEDFRGKDVHVLEFFDGTGNKVASTVRKGSGCCLEISGSFPFRAGPLKIPGHPTMKIFTCVALSIQAFMDDDKCFGLPFPFRCLNGRGDWFLMPHGFLSCDPVVCKGCVKGPVAKLNLIDIPLIWVPFPHPTCCCVSYPMMKYERTLVPVQSTFRYENMLFSAFGEEPGQVQFQYRGNYRSAYEHDEGLPFTSAMSIPSGLGGLIASAIMMARSYSFGLPEPLLADVEVTERGPHFDGYVKCYSQEEIQNLQLCCDDRLNVLEKCKVGDLQVQGYTLLKIGYNTAAGKRLWLLQWGDGVVRKPVEVMTKEKLDEVVKNGMAEGAREWTLRFMLKDPEKSIITKQSNKVDKGFEDYYHAGGAKVKSLTCSMVRVCAFPLKTDRLETTMCRIPIRVEYPDEEELAKDKMFLSRAPSQVVMHVGSRIAPPMPSLRDAATSNEKGNDAPVS